MYEIRFHGRGGQGAVLASKILAKALAHEGKHVKAIPSFGFERRGAPVASFLRYDEKNIRQVTNIYHPNCIICLDPTLPKAVDIFAGLTENGTLVQCTKKHVDEMTLPASVAQVGLCDAFHLALSIFGRPITNSIMLGAFARTTGVISIESLQLSMASVAFRDAALDVNIEAIRKGFENTRVFDAEYLHKPDCDKAIVRGKKKGAE